MNFILVGNAASNKFFFTKILYEVLTYNKNFILQILQLTYYIKENYVFN